MDTPIFEHILSPINCKILQINGGGVNQLINKSLVCFFRQSRYLPSIIS